MKIKFFISALLLTFVNSPLALAEDRSEPAPDTTQASVQVATSTDDSRETTTQPQTSSTEIPSAISLFFRDIGQRIQLIFTFDPVRDSEKRIQFANDNLALAQKIMAATDDQSIESRAQGLVDRANALSQSVLDNWEKWSQGDATAVSALTASVTNYFSSAEALVTVISSATNDETIKTNLSRVVSQLSTQKQAVADVIASKLPQEKVSDAAVESTFVRVVVDKNNDHDRDGIPDKQETDFGTSNKNFDSDGDGLSDRAEIEKYGTDPTNADTDGDSFRDGLEVLKGFNPLGSGAIMKDKKIDAANLKFITVIQAKPALDPKTVEYLNNVLKNYQLTTSTK